MERIFYNTKLKKIIVSMLVVMIFTSYILPSTVYAISTVTGPYSVEEAIKKSKDYGKTNGNLVPSDEDDFLGAIVRLWGNELGIDSQDAQIILDGHKDTDMKVYIREDWETFNFYVSKIEFTLTEEEEKELGIKQEDIDEANKSDSEKIGEGVKDFFTPVEGGDPQYFITKEQFYIKNTQNGIVNFKPSEETPQYPWELDTYIITEDGKECLKDLYKINNPDLGNITYMMDPAIVEQGCETYNRVLREKYAELQNFLTNSPSAPIDVARGKGLTLQLAVEAAANAAISNVNTLYDESTVTPGEVIEGLTDEDTADLGGILLSPLFYLINFIADAIISNVGSLMDGNGITLTGGAMVLTDSKVSADDYGYDPNNTKEITVDIKSFLPNFGWSISAITGGQISYQYPNTTYTPEEIFTGKKDLLSIDFISGKDYEGNENQNTGWQAIRKVVSQWYQVMRMIAIIGLLSVLIYTGLKIIISANAKDKAKYKEWIGNWVMAAAILFAMHIIMAFIISVTGEFSKLMTTAFQGIKVNLTNGDSFVTNLMGLVRFMIQSENFYIKVGYEVMYIALIVYTIKFTFVYLKRVLNMAFLTLIAPIVALTYPIDKINDGKAQGFDMWLKEYIFNALFQPMHLIMYYVLVGSAVSIAATNPIYGIVVLAFMSEAEKLLKKIFGFDKASGGTVGGMASAFAAGAIASNLKNIAKLGKGSGGKGGSGDSEGGNELLNNLKPSSESVAEDKLFVPIDSEDDSDEDLGDDSERGAGDDSGRGAGDDSGRDSGRDSGHDSGRDSGYDSGDDLEDDSENSKSIKKLAEESKFVRGMANVGKRIAKPVWDFDHKGKSGRKYNRRRLAKKVGRAALGAGLGIGAAAVQAGISITDGKYNPAEGIATFAAGYAGGGQLAKGMGSLYDTYQEGTLSENPKERNEELIKRAQDKWPERDDVIKYNKKYDPKDREDILDIQKRLLAQGITDPKEMDKCIKYLKKANNDSLKGIDDKMIQKSRVVADFYNKDLKDVGMQKAVRDLGEREKYIDGATKHIKNDDERNKAKARLGMKFDETAKFLDAQR